MGLFTRQTEGTRRHVLKARLLHCQQRKLTSFTQELLFEQKGRQGCKKGGKNQAQVAFVNFKMQRGNKISTILLLALTAALFSAERVSAPGIYVVVRVAADVIRPLAH